MFWKKCGNAGNYQICGISRTIAGWLTPMPKLGLVFRSTVLPLHLELLLGGAKHLNFISPPRPNPSVYLIPYFQSPFTCPLIRGVIWGFGTATACITSGAVPPHAIPSIMHALAVSVVKDILPNPISIHAEPQLWPDTSLLHQ